MKLIKHTCSEKIYALKNVPKPDYVSVMKAHSHAFLILTDFAKVV